MARIAKLRQPSFLHVLREDDLQDRYPSSPIRAQKNLRTSRIVGKSGRLAVARSLSTLESEHLTMFRFSS